MRPLHTGGSLLAAGRFVSALGLALAFGALAASAGSTLPAGRDFGAGITLAESQKLADVEQHPERFADRPILLSGRITDVCQKKGCWTVLTQGEHHLRIRFKDYAFFLPKDSSGKQAWVEGIVQVELEDEGDAKHYAQESMAQESMAQESTAQKPKPSKPVRRLRGFTASGVRLVD